MLTLSAICAAIQAGCTPGELARMRREAFNERKNEMTESEQLIIDLIKNDGDIVLFNTANKRVVGYWRGEWVVSVGDKFKPIFTTSLFKLALKWLKGEE